KLGEALSAQLGDSSFLGDYKVKLARYHSIKSEYARALRYDLEALSIYQQIGDELSQVKTLNDIGADYYDQDLYKDAYLYYQKTLEKAETVKDTLTVAISTYNIGRVLKSIGQREQSMEYFTNSLQISRQIGDMVGVAYSFHDLGEILFLEKNYDGALTKLKQSLNYCDSLNIDELKPQVLTKIGDTYREKKSINKSLQYYDLALRIYERQSNKRGIGEAYFGKATSYLNDKVYDRARELFGKTLSISEDIQDYELKIKSYENLSKLYESQGDLELALVFHKKFKMTQDSVFSEKKSEEFSQMQMEYQVSKKNDQIERLSKNKSKQSAKLKNKEFERNIFVVILALTGILFANLYRNSALRKKKNKILLEKQRELKRQGNELKSLLAMKDKFFSIISHDLRSPLKALSGIIDFIQKGHISQDELKEVTKSLKFRLDSTNKLMDNLLSWAVVQMNDINPEYTSLNLGELVRQNFTFFNEINEKNIDFVSLLKENVEVKADQNMLDLVIRNLISNAIKFTEQDGKVTISSTEENDLIVVEIKDNGIGMNQEQVDNLFDVEALYTTRGTANEKGTGLGLRLCKEFIEKMGGKIWVDSKEGEGSIFKFTLRKAGIGVA
ncbi:MAG: tetratricopeptide repeat-containing sensor histidine kinase, partial [Bacteroidota bacterium]